MPTKKSIIIGGLFLIILMILSLICFLLPSISIKIIGPKNININLGDEYVEEGAEAYLNQFSSSQKLDVDISGTVNTQKFGKYIILYKTRYKSVEKEAIRVVNVVDNKKPEITLNKDVTMCKKNNTVEIDAKAIDNYDGDISDKIKYRVKDNKIYISVADSFNNISELVTDVKYIDEEKPKIKLNGSATVYLNVGEEYQELGASASDSCDGNISENLKITGTVNSAVIGTYEILYKVSDSVENEVTVKRMVIVSDAKDKEDIQVTDGTIYLTFDDGPGPYTQDILDTLDKYDIKATFFVTNQFGNQTYLSYIKKEYENGHTVGIHTYSHKWSIYQTIDTYLDDFNKIHEIVVAQTGVAPKYFRFPGGTSNRQAKVSMKKLAELMTEKGYTYFDWHIDCGDTHGKKATKEYIINMVKTHLKGNGDYIILMHDIKKNTRDALPEIIEYAKSRGYTFKKIDENTPIKQFKPYN